MGYNILFYTFYKVSSTKGGTERTTISTATGLKEIYGCKCYSLYCVQAETLKEDCFEEEFHSEFKNLPIIINKIIEKYKIDIVISQGDFSLYARMGHSLRRNGVIYTIAHHFQPAWEENYFTVKTLKESINKESGIPKIKAVVKLIAYFPYFRPKYLRELKYNYRKSYEFADRTVLLSHGFIDEYVEYCGLNDKSKFVVIPNSLSYPDIFDIADYGKKKKKVLIVSRMDEPQKKISHALKIWKEAKSSPGAEGWSLDIVGDGEDLNWYKEIVDMEGIPDVTFHGRQIPDKYYKEASIFMMTSKSEGWGLTLTESQQFAVVPIVYNTVAPFKDIIENNVNGVLVEPWNEEKYVSELLSLMTDSDRRERLAIEGYRSCKRFSHENVARLWMRMFEQCDFENSNAKE